MKKIWIGKYIDIGHKGKDEEFAFRIDAKMDEEMSFSGTVWEEEFSEKSNLHLTVEGFISEDHISFVKYYPCSFESDENFNIIIDKNKKGHEVVYDGYWNDQKEQWEGTWEVKGSIISKGVDYFEEEIITGSFDMKLLEESNLKIFAISGLGADERVFKYLTLEQELIPIVWITPKTKESIVEYSQRLIKEYQLDKEENFGILGVSFGGLVATEISKLLNPKFTILISSAETRSELNGIIKLAGRSKLIELIPESLFNPPKAIAHFLFGTDNKELLNSILDNTDLNFAKWATRELMNWQNHTRLSNLIKIGGSKDKLLAPKGNKTIIIERGEHFMIVDRADEISEILNEKIKMFNSK